jgi:hypothetical protein
MKKRIFAALLALMVVAMAATATGITYQEFTWNEIVIPMVGIETPENVGDWLYPADGSYFISVSMQLTADMVADDELIKALDEATFLVMADGTEIDNSIRSTTAETGMYACIYAVSNEYTLEDFEFIIKDAVAVEIEAPLPTEEPEVTAAP